MCDVRHRPTPVKNRKSISSRSAKVYQQFNGNILEY